MVLLNKKGRIAAGPDGSNIYYCHNKKNTRMPVPVEYDTRVNGKIVTRLGKSCVRFRSFNLRCHTESCQIECTEYTYFKTKCKLDNRTGANEFCKCQPREKLWKRENKHYSKEKRAI